ncbi:hypothetical protein G3O06_05125 [Burkholderia sp. Ac-20345]|uniref:hypothetical protein n=1 Tax=Burkholderia sp. Ac-20345 TaxID=2703891 RepID=UPI00197C5D99|nr:hypothetical protein [Burkholderia sp. Ac-20345]MBN3776952.1 hypothetical protein [Burkholderia sp. Ac-20345]
MKQQDIKVGSIYTDGKAGLRRVTAAGPQYKLYDGQEESKHETSTVCERSVTSAMMSGEGHE